MSYAYEEIVNCNRIPIFKGSILHAAYIRCDRTWTVAKRNELVTESVDLTDAINGIKHPGAHGGHNPRGTLQFPPLPSLSHSERTLHACLKRSTCRMPTPQIQPSVSSQRTARKVSGFQLPRSALMARSPLPSHFAGLLLSHSVETSVSPPSVSSARATKRIRVCSYS